MRTRASPVCHTVSRSFRPLDQRGASLETGKATLAAGEYTIGVIKNALS